MKHDLIIFSRDELKLSYDGEPSPTQIHMLEPLVFCGRTLSFTTYIMGEGSPGGSMFQESYLARLQANLFVNIISYSGHSATYCESELIGQGECPSFVPEVTSKYETPMDDFQKGREVLNTVELLGSCGEWLHLTRLEWFTPPASGCAGQANRIIEVIRMLDTYFSTNLSNLSTLKLLKPIVYSPCVIRICYAYRK